MTSGPDDDLRQPSEPSFADVLNGFSLDSGRASKRRRWGRRREEDMDPEAADASPAAVSPDAVSPSPPTGPIEKYPAEPEPAPAPLDMAAAVRPYAWTRGRTKSGFDLAIETLVSTSQRGLDQIATLQVEHRAVAHLCSQTRSVAEVAALMSLPLGVARVLLGDMAGLGVLTVHQTISSAGNAPDLALMERVLSGLRRL